MAEKIPEEYKELAEEYEREVAREEYWKEEERYKNSLEPKLDSILDIVKGIHKKQKTLERFLSFSLFIIIVILIDNAFMGQLWEANFSDFLS